MLLVIAILKSFLRRANDINLLDNAYFGTTPKHQHCEVQATKIISIFIRLVGQQTMLMMIFSSYFTRVQYAVDPRKTIFRRSGPLNPRTIDAYDRRSVSRRIFPGAPSIRASLAPPRTPAVRRLDPTASRSRDPTKRSDRRR